MSKVNRDFYLKKRSWSNLKDRILQNYMPPYLAKVSKLGKEIFLIDAFAGQGLYEDGTTGSPITLLRCANKYAPKQYHAYFINLFKKHHEALQHNLPRKGITQHNATFLNLPANDALHQIHQTITTETIFLYLDPFGVKDLPFSMIQPFLGHSYSVEVLINFNISAVHRHAAREKYQANPHDAQIQASHRILDRYFGGSSWKSAALASNLDTQKREQQLVAEYTRLLRKEIGGYTLACPVKESVGGATKYFLIFATRQMKAIDIMQDIMFRSFQDYMNEIQSKGTFFEPLDWREWRNDTEVDDIVEQYVYQFGPNTRLDIWYLIIENDYMRMAPSEYRKSIQRLVDNGRVICSTPPKSKLRPTKALNDRCVIEPPQAIQKNLF